MLSNAFVLAQGSGGGGGRGRADALGSSTGTTHVATSGGNYSDPDPYAVFVADCTVNETDPTWYNFTGPGGNDTFYLFGGFRGNIFVATAGPNATFDIVSGNGTSIFDLMSGAYSNFTIVQDNPSNESAILYFAITAGVNSSVYETGDETLANATFAYLPYAYDNETGFVPGLYNVNGTVQPVGRAFYSIILGANSTIDLGSVMLGNETAVNAVF